MLRSGAFQVCFGPCCLLQGIKKKKPNKVLCDADELNIYSFKESFDPASQLVFLLIGLPMRRMESGLEK